MCYYTWKQTNHLWRWQWHYYMLGRRAIHVIGDKGVGSEISMCPDRILNKFHVSRVWIWYLAAHCSDAVASMLARMETIFAMHAAEGSAQTMYRLHRLFYPLSADRRNRQWPFQWKWHNMMWVCWTTNPRPTVQWGKCGLFRDQLWRVELRSSLDITRCTWPRPLCFHLGRIVFSVKQSNLIW